MLISVKYNFVFLCTPKCASNSIEDMLLPYSDISLGGPPAFRHTNYRDYANYIKPYLKETIGNGDLETVCVVREPLSWLNSFYRYRSRFEIRNPNHPNFHNSTHGIEFAEFVKAYMLPEPPAYADLDSQYAFVKNDQNEVGVDKIFPYENMEDFIEYMSQKVGKKLKMDYKNVSPKKNESNLMAITNTAKRKISSRLNLKQSANVSKDEYEISSDLLNELRQYIPKDFELYEHLKSGQKVY